MSYKISGLWCNYLAARLKEGDLCRGKVEGIAEAEGMAAVVVAMAILVAGTADKAAQKEVMDLAASEPEVYMHHVTSTFSF